jgi:hypothetical protein
LSVIQSSPTSPDGLGVVPPLDKIHRSQSVKKTKTPTSVDVSFLRQGFLKPRLSRSLRCSSPAVLHPQKLLEVSLVHVSDKEGFVDGPHLPVVTVVSPSYLGCSSIGILADDKDGVSNGEEVEDPSLEFQDAIKEDFLRIVKLTRPKNKGRSEVLNLNSFIFLISKFIKKRKAPLRTPGVYTSSQSQHKKRKKPKKTPRGPKPTKNPKRKTLEPEKNPQKKPRDNPKAL